VPVTPEVLQQQTEMNPPDPPPVGIDQVVVAQMMVIQQMANMVTEMQNQIRQECQEIRQDQLEIRQEMRQARLERHSHQGSLPSPPPSTPPIYINIYTTICKI
jgi:TolA-binding protein